MTNTLERMKNKVNLPMDEIYKYSTLHGLLRTMERMKMNDQQALRFIKNAWERGTATASVVWQRDYLDQRDGRFEEGATEFRMYCGQLCIFTPNGEMVTMYPLPADFNRKRAYNGKERIRNARRFDRSYHDTYDELELA